MNVALAVVVAATIVMGVRIEISTTDTRGDFGVRGSSLCGSCVVVTERFAPADGTLVSQNWTLIEEALRNGSRWDLPVWVGGKFHCAGWSSSAQCGGGIVLYPNGTRTAEPCDALHRVLCACEYDPFQFAFGLDPLCTIQDGHDVYCASEASPPTMMRYVDVPPANEMYGGVFTFVARLLNGTYTAWGAFISAGLPEPPSPIADFGFSFNAITIRTVDGGVYSVGDNSHGMGFGDGGAASVYDMEQWHAALVPEAAKLVTGFYGSCVIAASNSSVWCWGANPYGERGDGSDIGGGDNSYPSEVILPFAPSDMCGSGVHYCVTRWDENGLWCWGTNFQGEGGRVELFPTSTPQRSTYFDIVMPLGKRLVCGFGITCVQLQNNSYACTGSIEYDAVPHTPVLGYAQIFDRLEGLSRVTRGEINSVCGVTRNQTLQCIGNIVPHPPTDSVVRIAPGSLCAAHDTYSPYVCAIAAGRLVCVGGVEADRSNFNLVTTVLPANASRIFCDLYYVSVEFDTGHFMWYSPFGDWLLDINNFTLPAPVRSTIKDPSVSSIFYLGEDNRTHTAFYDDYGAGYSVFPSEMNSSFLDPGQYLHIASYVNYICAVNTTHPRVVSVREAPSAERQEWALESDIAALHCGPMGYVAWIYVDGGLVVKPSNPFEGSLDVAADVAINSVHLCALARDTEGTVHCFQRETPESDVWFALPTSVQLSLPRMTRLEAGFGFMCAEGAAGDAWCFHQYQDYDEGAGPIGTNPLRVFFGSPP